MKRIFKESQRVKEAMAERLRIRKLNRPTLLINRQITARNKELRQREGITSKKYFEQKESHLKYGFELPKEAKAILKAELDNKTRLSKRTPEQWLKELNSIENEAVKTRLACVVWWDFFGTDEDEEYSDLLDNFLFRKVPDVAFNDFVKGLISIGYSPDHALSRLLNAEDQSELQS